MKRSYSTDLTDAEWRCLQSYVPAPKHRGRPRIHSTREILNAVFYVLKSGCPWRLVPRNFPPWESVYFWFRRWRIDGTWERLNAAHFASGCESAWEGTLNRVRASSTRRRPRPPRGGRRAERVRWRQEDSWHSKRQLLVDTEGLVLKAKVHSAKVPDQDGLKLLLDSARTAVSGLKHLWLDAGYEGRGKCWAEEVLSLSVEIVRKPKKPVPEKVAILWAEEWAKEGKKVDWQKLMPQRGFVVLPRRWVVERTFSLGSLKTGG